MSAPGFPHVLDLRLKELHGHLVVEHELAVQQAVGHRSQQLALENSLLRSEIKALRQRMASRPTDTDISAQSPPRAQRPPASPDAFAELLDYFYREEEPLELFSSLLQDAALCHLYAAQRGCRECFRESLTQRRARQQRPREKHLGKTGGVGRTTSNSSLLSTRVSEVEWISIAEPRGARRSSSASPHRAPSARAGSASPRGSQEPPPPAPALRCSSAPAQDSNGRELDGEESEGRASVAVQDLGHCEQGWGEGEARAPAEVREDEHAEPAQDAAQEESAGLLVPEDQHIQPAQDAAQEEAAGLPAPEDQHSQPAQDAPREEAAVLRAPEDQHSQPAQDAAQAEAAVLPAPEDQHSQPAQDEAQEEAAVLPAPEDQRSQPAQDAAQEEAAVLPAPEDQHSQPAEDEAQEEMTGWPAPEDPELVAPEESAEDEPQAEAAEPAPQPARKAKGPSLTMVLVKAKPSWTSKERMAAQSKLAKVGVRTAEDLAGALKEKLNDRLRQAGMHPFTSSTLQALTKCISDFELNGTEVATNGKAKVEAAAGVNGKDPEPEAKSEDTLLGLWVGDDSRFSYEIRSLDDGGFRQDLGPRAVGEQSTGLWYAERLASGEMLAGALEQTEDPRWPWEVGLHDGSRLRLRRDFAKVLVSELYVPGSFKWGQQRIAERPQAYAFFNAMEQKEGFRFVHLPCEGGGVGDFPLIGLTAGWVPAALSGDKENAVGNHSQVSVKLLGSFCDPFDVAQHRTLHSMVKELAQQLPTAASSMRRGAGRGGFLSFGNNPMQERDEATRVARHYGVQLAELRNVALFRGKVRQLVQHVCRRDIPQTTSANLVRIAPTGAPPRPLLSIIVVRYFDYWSDPRHSSDYNILNDGFFMDLFNGPNSPCKVLGGQVEIYTVFIRNTADLAKLQAKHLRAMLKGVNVTAWYFLWPSSDGVPGEVHERVFFRLCQDMERLPIRMGWPHQSSVYRLLCGKLWIPQMSLNRRFRVPPTVRVHFAEYKRNPRKAAERALESLIQLRRKVWGSSDGNWEEFKGVVKLGFSWCGADVLPFRGISSLVKNLGKLLNYRRCENTMCLVQEMVPEVVGEFRVLVMHDRGRGAVRRETMWMENGAPSESCMKHQLHRTDVADFSMASHITVDPQLVAKRFFRGDRAAQLKAEDQAMTAVDHWMRWYSTENHEPPQSTRIDFLVGHSRHGEASVWTCEVGENGGSLCTVEVHGRNLAALNRAVIKDDSGRFPIEFPPRIPRNNGEKG